VGKIGEFMQFILTSDLQVLLIMKITMSSAVFWGVSK
jgi:hypothetical protein